MSNQELREMSIWKPKKNTNENNDMFMMADINELGLINRASNALRRARCNTIEDLTKLINEDKLKSVHNLGSKSVEDIMKKYKDLQEVYRASAIETGNSESGYYASRVMLTTGNKTWKTEIRHYTLSEVSLKKFKEAGIVYVSDLYSPTAKDPGWKPVRELFEAIVNYRVVAGK